MFLKKKHKQVSEGAIQLLTEHQQVLKDESIKHAQTVFNEVTTLPDNWEQTIQKETAFIVDLCKGREALGAAVDTLKKASPLSSKETELRFQVSSLFLAECWQFLVSDPAMNERIHLVTGTVADDLRVLSKMEHIKVEKQSSAYVSAEDDDCHLRIVDLAEKHGHLLLAVFHSHISHGKHSTHPSQTDLANQDRLKQIGCEAIGGIFSLDGYIRFFSTFKPFSMEIYGRGTRLVEDKPKEKVLQLLNE